MGWLVDVLDGVGWRWTPAQILDTDAEYPGLVDDIVTEVWQRGLIKEQMENDGE